MNSATRIYPKNTYVCNTDCSPLLAASLSPTLVHAHASSTGFPSVLTLPSLLSGMDVVKVGGPVYRIGVGGGAASSVQVRGTGSGADSVTSSGPGHRWGVSSQAPPVELCHLFPQVQGDNTSELDFGAVQRGDPEMEQKMNRVIRACVEAATGNPICSLHDQGAGGNGEEREWDEEPGLCKRPPGPGSPSPPSVPSGCAQLWGGGGTCRRRTVGSGGAAAAHAGRTELGAPLEAGVCPLFAGCGPWPITTSPARTVTRQRPEGAQ